MPRTVSALLVALLPFLHGYDLEARSDAGAEDGSAEALSAVDFQRVADVLLARPALQPDEHVLLVALPGRFNPLMPLLRKGIEAAGGEE